MTNYNRFTAWHPKRILFSCFSVRPFGGMSCSIFPQTSSDPLHNNELSVSCVAQNSRTENVTLPSGIAASNLNRSPVFPRAETAHALLAEQSGGNLRGLFDFASAQPERIKTKSIGIRMVSTTRQLRLWGQTRNSFFMGVIPFLQHSGWATSVYEKGCASANFLQESVCSPA